MSKYTKDVLIEIIKKHNCRLKNYSLEDFKHLN